MGRLLRLATCLLLSFGILKSYAEPQTVTLTPENLISLDTEINNASINETLLKFYKTKEQTIYLYLNSPGGSVYAGLRLVEYLKLTDKTVICIANLAASMAFVILQTCNTRYALPNSYLMAHNLSFYSQGPLTLKEMEKEAKKSRKLQDKLNTLMAKGLGIPVDVLDKLMNPEYVLEGEEEIIAGHAADKIVVLRCSAKLQQQTRVIVTPGNIFMPERQETVSACPL